MIMKHHQQHFLIHIQNFDTQKNDINDELNETDREKDDEDIICWSLIKEQIIRLSES
jgi:hypothetical protein